MAERTVSVKLRADIADYVAKMQAAGKSTRELEAAGKNYRKALGEEDAARDRARASEAKLAQARRDAAADVGRLSAAEKEHAGNLARVEAATNRSRAAAQRYARAQTAAASGKPVVFEADLDDRLAKAKAAEFVAKRRTAVIGLDADIAKLRAKLAALEGKRGISVDVDARIAKAEAELAALVARRRTVMLEVKAKTRPAEEELSRMAKRANAQFDALKFTGLSVGLPAAAAIGAAGVGASLTLLAGGFAALGVNAAVLDDTVVAKFQDMTGRVAHDARRMGGSFKTEVAGAIDDVGKSWDRLRPQISRAVDASAPAVRILTGAVTDFAEGAMPGMVTAVETSRAPLLGFRALLGQTGTGLGEFFANASAGAQGAGQGMTLLGGIVQMLLSRFGTLFANLAAGSAGPLNQLDAMLDALTGALTDVTAHTGGVLGFLHGFGSGATGAAQTLRVLLGVLDALPPEVTGLAGSFKATSMIMSKFGVDAGKGWEGLGQRVREAGSGMTGAAKAGTKVGTAIGGLVGGALNPAALAVGALGIGLNILGEKQQRAAANAAAHADRVRTLSEALRASGGVVDETVRKLAVESLGHFQVADEGFRNLNKDVLNLAGPQGLRQLQDAYLGNTAAGDKLKATLQGVVEGHRKDADALGLLRAPFDDHIRVVGGVAKQYDAQAFSAQQLFDILSDGSGTFAEATKDNQANAQALKAAASAAREVTPAHYAAQVASTSLTGAFEALNKVAGDTAAKGQAIVTVLDELSGRHKSEEEALQAWNDHLRGIGDAFKNLGLAKHTKDLIDSSGAVNTVSEAGSKLQDVLQQAGTDMASMAQSMKDGGASTADITGKLAAMRGEFAKQLKQLGLNDSQIQTLLAHYGLVPDQIVTAMSLEGDTEAQKRIQDVAKKLREMPPGKSVVLNADEKPAADALEKLGYKVQRLPDGRITVSANTIPAETGIRLTADKAGKVTGTIKLDANAAPANGKLAFTIRKADGSTGTMILDARQDPATRKLQVLVQSVNGSWGWMNIDAYNTAAKSVIGDTVRVANGARGFVQVGANAGAADSAINWAARNRSSTITVTYDVRGLPKLPAGANRAEFAAGGVAMPMASGGVLGMAAGGRLSPMRPVAAKVPPNTWRVVGDRMRGDEYYLPADNSARSQAVLARAMADPNLGNVAQQIISGVASVQQFSPRIVIAQPPAEARRGGEASVTIHTAESDPQRIAAMASSQLAWILR